MSEFSLVPLGQLADIRMGQSPDSTYVYEGSEQGVPFLQGNAEFGVKHPAAKYSCTQPAKVAEEGSSLISVRAPVGETNIADQFYCIGRGLAAVKFHHYGASLGRELLSFSAKSLDKVSQGTTFAAIGGADLRTLLVADIPNQEAKTLERVLDTLDTQIEKTESLIAKLEKVKEGLLHDLLTRGIDENGQLRPSPEQAPELYQESPLGLIPREWEVKKISEQSTKVTNGFVGVATPHYTESHSGVTYLYGNNIRKNKINFSKHKKVTQRFHKAQIKSQLKDGDMLTVQSGHIGTSAVFDFSKGEANCHALIITRFIPDMVNSRFASLYLNSTIGMRAQSRLFIGSTILHINTSDLAKLSIPTPSLTEQKRVIDHFIKIEKRLQIEANKHENLVKLKRGLMDDLLTGRIRITPLLEQLNEATSA